METYVTFHVLDFNLSRNLLNSLALLSFGKCAVREGRSRVVKVDHNETEITPQTDMGGR